MADPPSDDFVTHRPSQKRSTLPADAQIECYMRLRDRGSYDLTIWEVDRSEMPQLRIVALRAQSIVTTSASVERVFSLGSLLCAKRQLAMGADRLSV
jgi:hypothetical protein